MLCTLISADSLTAPHAANHHTGDRLGNRAGDQLERHAWDEALALCVWAGRTPEGASGAAAAGGRATGAQTPRGSSGRTSAGATAGPSAAAAEDPGSHSVLEGFGGAEPPEEAGAAAAKSSAAAVPGDTAVPPAADRLFGAPLPRAAIYGGGAAFEPEAYRRCVAGGFSWLHCSAALQAVRRYHSRLDPTAHPMCRGARLPL